MGLTKSSEPWVPFTSFVELSCLSGNSFLGFFFFSLKKNTKQTTLGSKVLMQYLFNTILQEARCSLDFIQAI